MTLAPVACGLLVVIGPQHSSSGFVLRCKVAVTGAARRRIDRPGPPVHALPPRFVLECFKHRLITVRLFIRIDGLLIADVPGRAVRPAPTLIADPGEDDRQLPTCR